MKGSDLADVFQEVFVAVLRNASKFDRADGKAKYRAWLKTVTNSKVNDFFRRGGKEPAGFGGSTALQRIGEVAAPAYDDSVQEDITLAHSEEAFFTQRTVHIVKQEFREKTWQAFYRMTVDEQTSQQVAEELGMSAP